MHRSFEELQNVGGQFDLLVMSHVLEHCPDPSGFLRTCLGFLNPGGAVFVEVPCRDHEFKDLDEPHLVFFDKPSMHELFMRSGLDAVQLSYHGTEISRLVRGRGLTARFTGKLKYIARRLGIRPELMFHARIGSPAITDMETWLAVRPYEAHLTREEPSWWLRVLAVKAG